MNILSLNIKNSNNNLQSFNNQNSKSPRQVRSTSVENNTVEYNVVDEDMIDIESPNIIENDNKDNVNNNENDKDENNNNNYSFTNNIPLIKTISSYLNIRNKSEEKSSPTNFSKIVESDESLIKKMNDLESNINSIQNDNNNNIIHNINNNSNMKVTSKTTENEKLSDNNHTILGLKNSFNSNENGKNESIHFFNNNFKNKTEVINVEEESNEESNEESKKESKEESKEKSKEETKEETKEEEPLIEKKMLTNEEYELQTKLSTQMAMIELGTQIAEIKYKETIREKREKELTNFYDELLLDDELFDELWEEDFHLEHYLETLEDEYSQTFTDLNIKNQKMKNEFNKFVIAYSILNKKLQEKDEKIEEVSQELQDREEELEENIKELDEKDEVIKKDGERVQFLENRLHIIKKYYHSKKNRMYIEFAFILLATNLLNFTVNRFGIKYHLKILYASLFNTLYLFQIISKFVSIVTFFIFKNLMNFQIVYLFIFGLGILQLYQLSKTFIEQKFNIKLDFESKIIESFQRLNCFQKKIKND